MRISTWLQLAVVKTRFFNPETRRLFRFQTISKLLHVPENNHASPKKNRRIKGGNKGLIQKKKKTKSYRDSSVPKPSAYPVFKQSPDCSMSQKIIASSNKNRRIKGGKKGLITKR
ncbi:hypothetical protein CEXT_699521 [Caerostris extrusa]|uniref:Uncharacterized protein n=1 Tax=Caerostris extrusa TaxID=172846 RepID=A0AAV4P5E5_CAEEX|nr:hypothetical protein CEXT_699521 [Caerostris extrusa]